MERLLLCVLADGLLMAGIVVGTPGMGWGRRWSVYGLLITSRIFYRVYMETLS